MTRHELKEQDDITTSLQRFMEFVYARQKEILVGAAVLIVIVLAVFGWNYYSTRRTTNAQTQLSQAIAIFNDGTKPEKERFEKSLAEAQKTHDAYPSLPAGIIAQYYMALSQEGLGDTPKAVQNLQEVVQRGDAGVRPVAQFALASIYKKHGETAKAIEVYKQLYDSAGYSKPVVAFELGELYEANKQPDQAKDYYQKLVSEFPDSAFRPGAEEALKRLGVTPAAPAAQKPS
jgi:predicted negative regulator of RcsB-dependent stress response